MRSYADTLNGSGLKPSSAGICYKSLAVLFGLLLIAAAVFAGVRYIGEDEDASARARGGSSADGSRDGDGTPSASGSRSISGSRGINSARLLGSHPALDFEFHAQGIQC
jgi:hypothetical protein